MNGQALLETPQKETLGAQSRGALRSIFFRHDRDWVLPAVPAALSEGRQGFLGSRDRPRLGVVGYRGVAPVPDWSVVRPGWNAQAIPRCQIWEDFAGPGIDGWREVVQTRPIHAIITGHTHYWQIANDGRNAVVTTRSIGDPEGGPPGYTVAVFDGEDFAVAFRSIVDSGPLVLITHPREAILATGPTYIVKGPDEVRARIWSASTVETVGFRVDEGRWVLMQPDGERTWRAPLPGDRLTKGMHRLAVRVEAGDAPGEQEIEFVVDPTGRYTAVPMVRPVVTATNFC